MPRRRAATRLRKLACLTLSLLAAEPARASSREGIGLFTSLPIRWHEAESIRDLIGSAHAPHWALAVLEAQGPVHPLDSLLPDRRGPPLRHVTLLVMAQPRALAPQENVALDAWVRGGGRLLLLADPMLTADSRFSPGDPRRPQDMAMLSPILAHWGLRLEFDEDQQPGEHEVEIEGVAVPVNLPGRLVATKGPEKCGVFAEGNAARCAIGRGRVLVFPDAALLEKGAGDTDRRRAALEHLIALLRR